MTSIGKRIPLKLNMPYRQSFDSAACRCSGQRNVDVTREGWDGKIVGIIDGEYEVTKRAFVCRVKPNKNVIIDQALTENRIYSGLHRVPNLLNPDHTKESVKELIHAEHRGERNYPAKTEAEMFWIFSREMKVGDLIFVPARIKGKSLFFLARVAGEAYHDPLHYECRTTYRRPVRWLNDKVPFGKLELPKALYDHMIAPFRVQKTFLDISEFAEDVALLVDPATDDDAEIEAADDMVPFDDFIADFDVLVAKSMMDSSKERIRRINEAQKKPALRLMYRYERVRNHDVVAETLLRAKGVCEICGKDAPFLNKSGQPYLEVHHIVRLVDNGDDHPDNTIAICPNCHRNQHYGMPTCSPGTENV